MKRILVTGGTGVLGRQLTPRLSDAGFGVRVMSRSARPAATAPDLEWAQADLLDGGGLDAAVRGIDVIVHAATSPFRRTRRVDVDGTVRLLAAARSAGVGHFLYVSIVGIDRIPYYYYFRHKLAAERGVQAGGVPWSVLRAVQFHELLDMQIGLLAKLPILVFPSDLRFQLLDSGDAADVLVEAAADEARGRLPDIGGPKVEMSGEIVRQWLSARGEHRRVFDPPAPGRLFAAYRAGHNCVPENPVGSVTWEDWLESRYGTRVRREAALSRPPG